MLDTLVAPTAEALVRLVNGMVVGRSNLSRGIDYSPNPAAAPNNLYKHPVAGLTLAFSSPGGVVTFPRDMDLYEIVEEINAQLLDDVAHLLKVSANGAMVLALWQDEPPVELLEAGTANAYLGFSTTPNDPQLVQSPIDPTKIKIKGTSSGAFVCLYDSVFTPDVFRVTEDGSARITEDHVFRILE